MNLKNMTLFFISISLFNLSLLTNEVFAKKWFKGKTADSKPQDTPKPSNQVGSENTSPKLNAYDKKSPFNTNFYGNLYPSQLLGGGSQNYLSKSQRSLASDVAPDLLSKDSKATTEKSKGFIQKCGDNMKSCAVSFKKASNTAKSKISDVISQPVKKYQSWQNARNQLKKDRKLIKDFEKASAARREKLYPRPMSTGKITVDSRKPSEVEEGEVPIYNDIFVTPIPQRYSQ